MINNIRLWWKYSAKYYHMDFYVGIKNLIRWFPIIWKDRNWDNGFIYRILEHKLTLQAKYIGERNIHVGAKRDSEKMMLCVKLINKLDSESYLDEWFNYHESKHNFIPSEDNPKLFEMITTEISENFDNYFDKYKNSYKVIIDKYPNSNKKFIAMMVSKHNHEKAKRILFRLMENNIESWWD